jgi:chromatin segregation and condensation protein Rec8/ScpA/Scc1 (kleisin family)
VKKRTASEAPSELDPRAELVRRLLEYQKYRAAAEQLAGNDILDRDVFPRRVRVDEVPLDPEEVGLQEISIYKLIEALDRVLKSLEPKKQHEVIREHLSLSQAMYDIAAKVRGAGQGGRVTFFELFDGQRERSAVIITFLALLEMCKLRLLRVFQAEEGGDIAISEKGDALAQSVWRAALPPRRRSIVSTDKPKTKSRAPSPAPAPVVGGPAVFSEEEVAAVTQGPAGDPELEELDPADIDSPSKRRPSRRWSRGPVSCPRGR